MFLKVILEGTAPDTLVEHAMHAKCALHISYIYT